MVNSSAERTEPSAASPESNCSCTLVGILLESVTALAKAGEVEAACRFAGRACVALRNVDPALARRFDVLLHRITPALTW